jgi:hypothetical protein
MTNTKAIANQIVRFETVTICGSPILAAVAKDERRYFSPRHFCESLGISWPRQFRKIKADPLLSSSVVEMATQLPGSRQRRKYTMLPVEMLSGWLVNIKRVRPEVQPQLTRYRKEAFLALDAWFRQGIRNDEYVQKKVITPSCLREFADIMKQKECGDLYSSELQAGSNEEVRSLPVI